MDLEMGTLYLETSLLTWRLAHQLGNIAINLIKLEAINIESLFPS